MTDCFLLVIFISSGLYISFKDIRTYHLPLNVIYIALLFCTAGQFLFNPSVLVCNCTGAAVMLFVYLSVHLINRKRLGAGDVHYSVLCGFYSGIEECIMAAFVSSFSGLLYCSICLMKKNKNINGKKKIPFAPFMFAGVLIIKFLRKVRILEQLL